MKRIPKNFRLQGDKIFWTIGHYYKEGDDLKAQELIYFIEKKTIKGAFFDMEVDFERIKQNDLYVLEYEFDLARNQKNGYGYTSKPTMLATQTPILKILLENQSFLKIGDVLVPEYLEFFKLINQSNQ